MGNLVDIKGRCFGDWIIECFDDSRGKYQYYWWCRCKNCGNTKSIVSASLKRNKQLRCNKCNDDFGNKNKEDILGYDKDLTGNTYGKFTIKSFSHKAHSHSYWVAECECGNIETHVITFYTGNRSTKMCESCRLKEQERLSMEQQIENIKLNKNDISNENKFLVRKKFNDYIFKDDYVIINDSILIDASDFEMINGENRYIGINCGDYACFFKNDTQIFIHRLLMGLPNTYDEETRLVADHINGNTLDNRRSNLRVIKKEINPINCKKYKNNTSGVKGVSWLKRLNKWQVGIQINKKNIYLGVYSNFDEAVKVRKEAEDKYFGEYNRKEENIHDEI